MNGLTGFRRRLATLSKRWWVFVQSVLALVAVLLTTVFVTLLVGDKTSNLTRVLLGSAAVFVVGAHAWITATMDAVRDERFPLHPGLVLNMIRASSNSMSQDNKRPLLAGAPQALRAEHAIAGIELYLKAIDDTVAKEWSGGRFGDEARAEAVLMTRADDGFVTAAAWGGVRPRSLVERKANPHIYEGTEAAKLYKKYDDVGIRAPVWIVPDALKEPGYDHLGRDNAVRTKSTVLLPLYDLDSRLHGFVAITARQRANVFDAGDEGFWKEIWQLWEPSIIRHLLLLESLTLADDWKIR